MKRTLLGLAILAALAGQIGCQRISPAVQAQAAIVGQKALPSPCTTDADCERKAEKAAHYCKGITKTGERCRKHVKAEGEYCWMHAIQANPCWRPKGSQPKEDCYYEDGDVTRPLPGKP